jgi:hypothetical protein
MVAPVRWRLATSTSSGPHTSLKPGQDGKDLIGGVMANSQYNHFARLQATVSWVARLVLSPFSLFLIGFRPLKGAYNTRSYE